MLSTPRARVAAIVAVVAAAVVAVFVMRGGDTPSDEAAPTTAAPAPGTVAPAVLDPQKGTLTVSADGEGPSAQAPITVPLGAVSVAPAQTTPVTEAADVDLAEVLPVGFVADGVAVPYSVELSLPSSPPPVAAADMRQLFESAGWTATPGVTDPMNHPFTISHPGGFEGTLVVTRSPAGAHASVAVLHVTAAEPTAA